MSGEPSVILVGSESTTRLVTALAQLAEVQPRFVLVGGLAVMARLTQAHRATQDLDALVTGVGFTRAVAMLPSGKADGTGLSIGGVKVDTIEVVPETTWAHIAELDAPLDRLFVAAHLWAMQTASPLRVIAGTSSALVPVATVAALLTTKLHAYTSPRRNPDKRPGDALDVLELGRMLVQTGVPSFDVPSVVADAVCWALTAWREQAGVVLRRLRALGTNAPAATEAEIEALADLLHDTFASGSRQV